MLLDTYDLTDPTFWAEDDAYTILDEIRREGAVQRHESAEEGVLWAVLTHRDALAVLGDARSFSSQGGSLLGTGDGPPAGAGKMMALSDPPRHRAYREPVAPFFSARHAARLEERVRELTEQVVERLLIREKIDFVRDIGAIVPLTVMCDLMGIPAEDRDEVTAMCDQAFLGHNPAERRAAHQRLLPYLIQLAMQRREEPRDDIISALAASLELDEVVLNCDNIIVGGIQTVRHTAAMAMLSLMRNADAWRELQEKADQKVATEELLRWTSVGLHVLRTAKTDVELAGQRISAGDRVVVWTPAANRDAAVFEDPHRLDLARHPNRHIAFGWGEHYCIGGPLARTELRVLFTVLSTLVAEVEPLGAHEYNQSIINFGLDSFPVRLHRR
ncbi:cytochrome P450 [Streptosporangium carneum]|uniref:Cytochrome P450 n=1 Tax=Streptosporangium carneum TaxID=47481 RepID=A0A9W6I3E2_9ACTN|nr:cytochrome P450 [Streptosporangium carneum]GLK11311.1 cytochrome P450 [Streptosporangium carneum]